MINITTEINPKIGQLQASKLSIYIFDFNLNHFKSYRMKNEIKIAEGSQNSLRYIFEIFFVCLFSFIYSNSDVYRSKSDLGVNI